MPGSCILCSDLSLKTSSPVLSPAVGVARSGQGEEGEGALPHGHLGQEQHATLDLENSGKVL